MVLRAVVTAVDDSGGLQTVSVVTKNEKALDGIEVFRAYGFTSHPLVGSEGILLRIGGDSSHPVFICADDRRYRTKANMPGEVGLYSHEGDTLIFKEGNLLDVVCATKVTVTCPDVVVKSSNKIVLDTPNVDVPNGDITVSGISFLNHVHGGVQAGGADTDVPK